MSEPYFFWGGFCSQWCRSPFVIDGVTYRTAEHWMMAGKASLFNDQDALAAILKTRDPSDAKAIGRQIKNWDEEMWKKHRFQLVCRGSYEKFRQNDDLRSELLDLGDREIVEASPYDKIWGIGLGEAAAREYWLRESLRSDIPFVTYPGLNLLGEAIMVAREMLKPR